MNVPGRAVVESRGVGSVGASLLTFCCLAALAVVATLVVAERDRAVEERIFARDANAALAEVEREIERHLDVIDDLGAFALATWPGEIEEWRSFIDRRVTGGTHLAFTSTAGLVERVPAHRVDALVEREREADPAFEITMPLPLPSDQDRLVLTRTGVQDPGAAEPRGLELTAAARLLGIALPSPRDPIAVVSVDEAPEAVLEVVGFEPAEFQDNDIVGSNVLFILAVGEDEQDTRGWVMVPADVSYLLASAVEALSGNDISMAVQVPGADLDGDIGRYDGAGDLRLVDADIVMVRQLELGGWTWTVEMWGDVDSTSVIDPWVLLVAGLALAALFTILAETRRRRGQHLLQAKVELGLQRTLAETDHLTGLMNRQGLALLIGDPDARSGRRADLDGPGAVFFIDLDGFKEINDTSGHAVGDEVLIAVARKLETMGRAEDVAVRHGGDEFVLICPGLESEAIVARRQAELCQVLGEINDPVPVAASVGVAIAERSLVDELADLMVEADQAMYAEKQSRRAGARADTRVASG